MYNFAAVRDIFIFEGYDSHEEESGGWRCMAGEASKESQAELIVLLKKILEII